MRADRLVAILMMLQTRGQVTAIEVAVELEVSERTARRDLDALAMSGVPVYSQQGRNGGWRLAGGGRTDLSGLTATEAQALFLLAGPRATTPQQRAALRKLVRAMPEPFRERVEAARTAVIHDPTGWAGDRVDRRRPPMLDTIESAVIDARQIDIAYRDRVGNESTRRVHPLGLATKGLSWYLIADTAGGMRTFRVDRVHTATPTDQPVVRPDGFSLAAAWALVSDRIEEMRSPAHARLSAPPEALGYLRYAFGARLQVGPPGPDGRIELEVRGHSVDAIARDLARFGSMVEVTEPSDVRAELARLGRQLVECYEPGSD